MNKYYVNLLSTTRAFAPLKIEKDKVRKEIVASQ